MHRLKTKLGKGGTSVVCGQNKATCGHRGWQEGPEAGIDVLRTANRGRLVVTQGDLETVASVFGRTKGLLGPMSAKEEADMGRFLDAQVRSVMGTMKEKLEVTQEGPLQDVEVLMAKHELYSICFQELISAAKAVNPRLSGVLETLCDAYAVLLRQQVPEIIREATNGYLQEISWLRKERERDKKEAAELLEAAQAVEREAVAHHRNLKDARRGLSELENQNILLRVNSTLLVHGNSQDMGIRPSPNPSPLPPPPPKPGQNFPDNVPTVTASGTDDSKDSFSDRSRSTMHHARGATLPLARRRRELPPQQPYSGCRLHTASGVSHCRFAEGGGEGGQGDGGASIQPFRNEARYGMEEAATGMEAEGTRPKMSLKKLKDIIESVYVSKEKFDARCAAQRWPTQTLSNYFDEFMKHKYGLRSMARGHAKAVRRAVDAFEGEDNYVRVFGMTLRNEVDERFRLVQRYLERNVLDLVNTKHQGNLRQKIVLGNRDGNGDGDGNNRNVNKGDVAAAVACQATAQIEAGVSRHPRFHEQIARSSSRLPPLVLAADEWQFILTSLFGEADVQTIRVLIRDKDTSNCCSSASRIADGGKSRHPLGGGGRGGLWDRTVPACGGPRGGRCQTGGRGGERERSITLGVFMQVLLDYQLHRHLRCLSFFKEDFRKFDRNGDGVVNASEFLEVARRTLNRGHQAKQAREARRIDAASPCTSSLLLEYYSRKEAKLSPVRQATAQSVEGRDRGARGVANEELADIKKREEAAVASAASRLLQAVDPYQLGGIPFSACVEYLASDIAAGFVVEKAIGGE